MKQMAEAFYRTAAQLVSGGYGALPQEFQSVKHLIYSSPATLAFNSPGAQGFGVKRAGLAIPGSVMLLVSPGCCGRNTIALGPAGSGGDRMFYLLLDEADIVTGRHLSKIPAAVQEVCASCRTKPSAVMLCITCVDALLGTDMERVCRRAEEAAHVPVVPCYMYALTRDGRHPPMTAVRKSVYSLLKPLPKKADAMNILGFFAPLRDDCELYRLFRKAGVHHIREISRCPSFDAYLSMAQANFNLVLNSEARPAAQWMEQFLQIPSIELTRMYQLDKIETQYHLLAQALEIPWEDGPDKDASQAEIHRFRQNYGPAVFTVGEIANADPFELSLALLRYGFSVSEIYGTINKVNFRFIQKIAERSPNTKVYSNLSPTMLFYRPTPAEADIAIGKDAAYYHPECPHVLWCSEVQPFGYAGVRGLFQALSHAVEGRTK
jgi:nitrogenase molybdenum-cofactor synthesis protein NifE